MCVRMQAPELSGAAALFAGKRDNTPIPQRTHAPIEKHTTIANVQKLFNGKRDDTVHINTRTESVAQDVRHTTRSNVAAFFSLQAMIVYDVDTDSCD